MNDREDEQATNGFTIIGNVFSIEEVEKIITIIETTSANKPTFRRANDLFAIRQFLKEFPQLQALIFTDKFRQVIHQRFGKNYFVVKAIYFDKPAASNWFVAYHQDLTISVKEKADVTGFAPWTLKQNQYAVQPPVHLLESNFTIRIHLDDTTEENGALKVTPGSHRRGIVRPETINWQAETETICNVNKGGIMIMQPLLLHASGKTTNETRRRVIHIEFSNTQLPAPLKWAEEMHYNN